MKSPDNDMLDLETYDTAPSAVILSIGAVKFDEDGCYERIYINCAAPHHIEQQKLRGRTVSDSTMQWWEKQSEQARQVFTDPGSVSLEVALDLFANFLGTGAKVWGNGSDFDNVLLINAYHMYGMRTPWKYHDSRCFRTLKNLAPRNLEPQRVGTYHNALDDAIFQAIWAQAVLKHLSIKL